MSTVNIFKNEDGFHIVDNRPLDYFETMQDIEEHYASVLNFIRQTRNNLNLYNEKLENT